MSDTTEEIVPDRRTGLRGKIVRWVIVALAGTAALGALYVAAAAVTDRPDFCATACHEMRPFVEAWEQGPHKNQWCVDCHVAPGAQARLLHKFFVFKEISAHFLGDTSFPRAVAPSVPSDRCQSCHKTVVSAGFPHPIHAETACARCHAGEGHDVAVTRLKAAGLYSGNLMATQASSIPVKINGGVANLPGHKAVICSRCHDMKATPCSACHRPKHNDHANRGTDCASCHSPSGTGFAFAHPTGGNSCTSCHAIPAKHYQPSTGTLPPCVVCHGKVGITWASVHPNATSDCKGCHPLPAKHYQPASGSMPACTTCHAKVGTSWAFAHPNGLSNCLACHVTPANHAAGQCSTCHTSTSAFTFSHPNVREHSAKSFVCARCHPNGYTSYSCTCHGSNNPGGEGGGEGGTEGSSARGGEGGEHEGGREGGDGDGD
jgi:hypothetical protein